MMTVFRYIIFLSAIIVGSLALSACTKSELAQQSGEANATDSFRVMSYNIHHGEGVDGQIDLKRIARVIQEQEADIVALQEMDVGVERSERLDIARELSELIGLKYYAFGKNIDHQGGEYGNATLSRYPITEEANTHFTRLAPEQRGILQTVIDVGGRSLLMLNTHLDYRDVDEERLVNVDEIREKILPKYSTEAVIIAGDFNDVPGSATQNKMKAFMTDAWEVSGEGDGLTIPPDNPRRRIDYVFHDNKVISSKAWVPETMASDHLPVVVEFYFRR